MINTIEITEIEYKRLLRDSARLALLDAGGVDNWEYYGESLYHPSEGPNIEELEEEIRTKNQFTL